MITDKVLKTLEYDKILKKLHMHCGCCVSRELADELRPQTEFDDVNAELRVIHRLMISRIFVQHLNA